MSRRLGWIAIVWLVGLTAFAILTFGAAPTSTSLAARTQAVAQQLRCPVCRGESVADSPSGIAAAMRRIIRQRLSAGQSPEAIKAFFVSRYGPSILLAPPRSGVGILVWAAPPLLIIGGLGLLLTLIADWRARAQRGVIAGSSAEAMQRLRGEVRP